MKEHRLAQVTVDVVEQEERRRPPPRPCPVEEVVRGIASPPDCDADEGEVVSRVKDARTTATIFLCQTGPVKAEVGEARRVGGNEGDLHGLALSGSRVLAVFYVRVLVEEAPGGGAVGGGPIAVGDRQGGGGGGHRDLARFVAFFL